MKDNKRQLIIIVSLLLIAGFLITSLASYFVSRASLRSEIQLHQLPLTSDNVYSEIQRDLLNPIFIASLMATDTFLRDWVIEGEKDKEKISKYLREIKVKYNTFASFFVSENTMNYYHAGGVLKKVSPDEKRDVWYFRVREMKEDYEINVDPDMANRDVMTIFINYRVYDYSGNYIGATGVGLTVSAVKRLLGAYQKKYDRKIYFIDKGGDVKLAGSDFPASIKNIFQNKIYSVFSEKINSSAESSFSFKKDGEVTHVNIRYIKEFGWHLIVEQPERQTLKSILSTLIVNMAVCTIVIIVVLVLVTVTITSYQNKLETLRGIVPICSYCRNVRDDKGYWNQVEEYVSKHTEARFSHGICPDCQKKHFPEYYNNEPEKEKGPSK